VGYFIIGLQDSLIKSQEMLPNVKELKCVEKTVTNQSNVKGKKGKVVPVLNELSTTP
jgi:hypothetical protein